MNTKHTSGPWEVVRYTNYEGFSIQSQTESMYGCIAERWEDTGRDEAREAKRLANSALIASAPELLDALKEWVRVYRETECEYDDCRRALEMADAAIAKATGETA